MINVLSSLNLRHQNAALAVLKLVSGHVAAILFLILHTPQCSQAQLIGKIRSMVNSNSPAGALRQPDENEKKLLTAIDANNLADFTATIKKPVLLVNRIDRTTLMILAAKKGSLEMVQTLAEKPQSATRMDYKVYSARSNSVYYATPLAAAAGEAPREVIDFLLEKSKADTLITKASIQRRDAPFAGKLLNPLDAAAYNGRVAIFQSLLEKGYKINRSSAQSSSTLLWAAKGSCWECVDLCLKLKANFFDKVCCITTPKTVEIKMYKAVSIKASTWTLRHRPTHQPLTITPH